MSRIYFYWNDSTGNTNNISFWIYNATNMSAKTQVYYDSQAKSNHLFQWAYGNENDTYIGQFEADHKTYGNLTGSRTLVKGGWFRSFLGDIGEGWYHFIAIVMIVFLAALFGAKSAPAGVVVVAIMTGFFFLIEWIPPTTMLTDTIIIILIAMSMLAAFKIKRRGI